MERYQKQYRIISCDYRQVNYEESAGATYYLIDTHIIKLKNSRDYQIAGRNKLLTDYNNPL